MVIVGKALEFEVKSINQAVAIAVVFHSGSVGYNYYRGMRGLRGVLEDPAAESVTACLIIHNSGNDCSIHPHWQLFFLPLFTTSSPSAPFLSSRAC